MVFLFGEVSLSIFRQHLLRICLRKLLKKRPFHLNAEVGDASESGP